MKDVLIVGGGPAGLILSRYCREHGVNFETLDRGKIGQFWRDMRPGVVLLSPSVPGADWTSLSLTQPLWTLPGTRRPFPTREDFLRHLETFARENDLSVSEGGAVVRARVEPGGGFTAVMASGQEIPCRFLVIATGASSVPSLPRIPGVEDNPSVIHSSRFLKDAFYDRKRVLVIGGGNSAAEICLELAGTALVTLCTREPLRYYTETCALEDIRGASESLLKEMFRFRIVSLREADPVVAMSGGTVRFRSGTEETFDQVVCATGYVPRWIPVEGGAIEAGADGFPRISPVGESSIPGLFFCGSLARFHARCAFIHGFRNYVEKVFWDIADRL